ncbi:MAG TPA: glycosyltransferase [Scandinavium sp.]|jgi:glycosyltransferase involved in cell wall biosynthesis|uniref:glycosyltransferase family 2 protein n=1 Tax=Scandinavium sp. TaxID=2830653 RepID=UPI002E309167|nr:glycosyltransferase [Scandinavium sp.]HEX4501514.1 glycosyltransferase [Scandinavium sp.]
MTPRVSVILTVHKRTQFLAEALESLLAQIYRDYEIIVADDSGTAAARHIVAAYGATDRVRYLPNPTTLGIAVSVARAVQQARGDYVAILNDDDVWERDLLAKLVAPLESNRNCVLATSDHWIMDESGRIDVGLSKGWSVNFGRASLQEGIVSNATEFAVGKGGPAINISSVFRKDAIDWSLMVPDVSGAYDYWIACLLAATRQPIYYVPERLARWRTHWEMETRRRAHNKGENLVYIYSILRERKWFPELEGAIKAKLAEALFVVGRDKLRFNRSRQARSNFWRCFLLSRSPGALARAAVTFIPKPVQVRLRACLRMLQTSSNEEKGGSGSAEPLFRL